MTMQASTHTNIMRPSWIAAALKVEADQVDGIDRRPSLETRIECWRKRAEHLDQLAEECRRQAAQAEGDIRGREK